MNFYLIIFFMVILSLSFLWMNMRREGLKDDLELMKSFIKIYPVLQYHMDKAFDIIFKDKIMVYSIDGIKMDEKEYVGASKEFCKLTLKMLGDRMKKQFVHLYGEEETLLFNLTEYFNDRFENDEIRKSALDKLSSDDIDSESSMLGETLGNLINNPSQTTYPSPGDYLNNNKNKDLNI